jgi:hypothetical protein
MNTTDFGPIRPIIQPHLNGYSVPVALKQVERPGIDDGVVEHSWQGYLLMVPFLSELELDKAIAELPAGDYSADRQAALEEGIKRQRRAEYPPLENLLYAMAEDDAAGIAAYKACCNEAHRLHPDLWVSGVTYAPDALVQHHGVRYRKLNDGDNTEPDGVGGGWVAV